MKLCKNSKTTTAKKYDSETDSVQCACADEVFFFKWWSGLRASASYWSSVSVGGAIADMIIIVIIMTDCSHGFVDQ